MHGGLSAGAQERQSLQHRQGAFSSDEEIKKAIAKAEAELGEDGRVLVRVSGTEPLVRVMLEGKDEKLIEKLCDEIAEVVRERLI